MRKLILLCLLGVSVSVMSQIPYYASNPAKGQLTVYSSISGHSADLMLESYTYLRYGVCDYVSLAAHLNTSHDQVYFGPEIRGGYTVNDWFTFSLHAMGYFDMTDRLRFSNVCFGAYLGGDIIRQHRLFWLSNTYATLYRDMSTYWCQYWYLGSTIPLAEHHSLTPMIGCIHSWRWEDTPELSTGVIYTYRSWSFTLWCSEILSRRPILTASIEINLPT